MAFTAIATLVGGMAQHHFNRKYHNERQRKEQMRWNEQKRLADTSIQRRVWDAKQAGINPLVALGAQGAQTPMSRVGSAFRTELGQDISRAAEAYGRAQPKKVSDAAKQMTELGIENAKLKNEVLRTEIMNKKRRLQQQSTPTANAIKEPQRIIEGQAGTRHLDPGVITDIRYSFTGTGFSILPSEQSKDALEDSPMEYAWMWRNYKNAAKGLNKPPMSLVKKHFPKAIGVRFKMTEGQWVPIYPNTPYAPGGIEYLSDYWKDLW